MRRIFLIALSVCFFFARRAESTQLFTFQGTLTGFTSGVFKAGATGPMPGPTFSPGDPFTGSAFSEDNCCNPYGFDVFVEGSDFLGEGPGSLNPTGLTISAAAGSGQNPFGLLDTFGDLSLTFASGNGSFVLNGLSGNGGFGGDPEAIGFFVISGDITSFQNLPEGGTTVALLCLSVGMLLAAERLRYISPKTRPRG